MISAACTIGGFEDDHADGEGSDEGGIDHHGNPIFDEEERVYEQVTTDDVSVEFTVENFIGAGGRGGELAPRLVEGEHANLQFHITDPDTGEPLGGLNPAAWVDIEAGDAECSTRIQGYLSGTLDSRPAIDLNSYLILGMNLDNTISVLDPMIDVGGMTNLFSVILLRGTPQDWAMAQERKRLFVTLPDLDQVAVVDLNAFLVEETLDMPARPERILFDRERDQVWVTLGGDGGLAVIDADTLEIDTVSTGSATGAIALAPDDDLVVIGREDGVIVLDADSQRVLSDTSLRGTPRAAAVASDSGLAYLTLPDAGLISILDIEDGTVRARLAVDPGVTDIDISSDGRWGVAVNPEAEMAYIIEAARRRITHAVPVGGMPDQVSFTDAAAYIHTSREAAITVIPLDEIDPTGDVSVLTVPIGTDPPGADGAAVVANSMISTPDGKALLIPNPADDTVYFYTEGSEAALGGFQGHTLQPRAVEIADRSLKEPSPGVYTASIRIPAGGDFVVAFLLDEPSISYCFQFTARAEEEAGSTPTADLAIQLLTSEELAAGDTSDVRFALTDESTGEQLSDLDDVFVVFVQTGGNWSSRAVASSTGDGEYKAEFDPPSAGLYSLFFAVPSLGIGLGELAQLSLQVSG